MIRRFSLCWCIYLCPCLKVDLLGIWCNQPYLGGGGYQKKEKSSLYTSTCIIQDFSVTALYSDWRHLTLYRAYSCYMLPSIWTFESLNLGTYSCRAIGIQNTDTSIKPCGQAWDLYIFILLIYNSGLFSCQLPLFVRSKHILPICYIAVFLPSIYFLPLCRTCWFEADLWFK